MFTLIALIIVAIGVANWFSIGAFQYDFVAGLFGSQANIFSRLVYVIVGIAGIFLAFSVIRNKGKLSFKNKTDKEMFSFGKKANASTESSNDNSVEDEKNMDIERHNILDTESSFDNHKDANNVEASFDNHNNDLESSYDNSLDNNIQERASRISDKNRLSSKNYSQKDSNNKYHNNNHKHNEN